MKTIRQRILSLLEVQRQATSAEISRALGVVAANIRYHLKILEDEGAIQVIATRQPPGPGRPKRVYAVSRLVQQHNFDILSATLLDHCLSGLDETQVPRLLQQIAGRLLSAPTSKGGRAAAGDVSTGSPAPARAMTPRLVAAVQRLNQLQYQARWEANPDAPRIIFAHCPYRQLIDDRPLICQLDAAILQNLLGTPVRQIEKLAADRRGVPRCVFTLSADPSS